VFDAGVSGLHPEIIKMLGRLKFRTSYGQNQLSHAVEVAKLATVIAAELGADVETSKMAGALLHDLGKAMDHNVEGTHAMLGAEFAKRYGVNAKVVNAIASHHHEIEQETVEAVIVEAADAISGRVPGPAARAWSSTSSGCAPWKRLPTPTKA
jgi:ribonucrease Y